MKNFRNAGWAPYQRMLDICPNSTARGDQAFSPATFAEPPPPSHPHDDNPESPALDNETSWTGDDGDDGAAMHSAITGEATAFSNTGSSTLISTSAEKRKLDVNEDGTISLSSVHSAPPTSSGLSVHSSSVAADSEQPKKKKKKSTKASSVAPSSRQGSNKTSEKMTPFLLLHELQGSLNQLTSAVASGLALDPTAETVRKATAVLQQNEDGLSDEDCVILLTVFTKDPATVNTYNSLYKAHLRKPWVTKIINTEKRAELMAKRKEEQEDRMMLLQ